MCDNLGTLEDFAYRKGIDSSIRIQFWFIKSSKMFQKNFCLQNCFGLLEEKKSPEIEEQKFPEKPQIQSCITQFFRNNKP